jgi:hypothetical protein
MFTNQGKHWKWALVAHCCEKPCHGKVEVGVR